MRLGPTIRRDAPFFAVIFAILITALALILATASLLLRM